MHLTALRAHGCDKSSCWVSEGFVEAGVTVRLGAGWMCFMADAHFSNAHGCEKQRAGGYCDGIAVRRQRSNRAVRLIEAKTGADLAAAKPQLAKGAAFALTVPGVAASDLVAECHCRLAPLNTIRPRKPLRVGTVLIPVRLVVNGALRF